MALLLTAVTLWLVHQQCGLCQQATSSLLTANTLSAAASAPEYFVTITEDGNFAVGCQTFYPMGWNQWEWLESGAGAPVLVAASLPPNRTGPWLIRDVMSKGEAAGLNVIRAWATSASPYYALQTSPGNFSEPIFKGLDYALDQARQQNLKVILSLTNNWNSTGSVDQFVSWSPTAHVHEDFFSDPTCMQLYQQYASAIINRVNYINGRRYGDDPTIMAWDLINEPRCYKCDNRVQEWVDTMAAYVKSLDSKHLLTMGEEGFYPSGDSDPSGNQTWAYNEGQDFLADHMSSDIDFAAFHHWPDNWLDNSTSFETSWIAKHIADAATLGKPLLLEEFGKWVKNGTAADEAQRDAFYTLVYDALQMSLSNGSALKGAAFWAWYDEGQVGPEGEGGGDGLYGIRDTSSTFDIVHSNAKTIAGMAQAVPSCVLSPAEVPEAPDCSQTWVANQPGTGFEGTKCNVDINECLRQTVQCAPNAGCINTEGAYNCTCWPGYTGDGALNCTTSNQLLMMKSDYNTDGIGTLLCDQGQDIAYPEGAPGFVYDPTGYLLTLPGRQDGGGSAAAVDLIGCQQACELAQPECDAIVYNSVLQACFLKSGPSGESCQATSTACGSEQINQPQAACAAWTMYYRQTGSTSTSSAATAG
ncbi:hypothetical protein WJX82_007713 [Trebouxia sp. C0006]